MALLLFEGFDHWPSATNNDAAKASRYYDGTLRLSQSFANADGVVTGRFSYGQAKVVSSVHLPFVFDQAPAVSSPVYFLSFAVNFQGTSSNQSFLGLYREDGSQYHVTFVRNGSDLIIQDAGGNNVLTINGILPAFSWVWLTIRIYIDGTSGTVTVKDGSLATLGTAGPGNFQSGTQARTKGFIFLASGTAYHLDDLFFSDASGATWNDYVPDFEIITGAVDTTVPQMNTFSGSHAAIAEISPDDGTIVSTAGLLNQRLAVYIPSSVSYTNVRGIGMTFRVRVLDGLSRQMKLCYKTDDNATVVTVPAIGTTIYRNTQFVFPRNPETGSNWSLPGDISATDESFHLLVNAQ